MASFFYYRERLAVKAEDGGHAVYYDGQLWGLKADPTKAHQLARELATKWAEDDRSIEREVRNVPPRRDREGRADG